jgi:hypothetical protein
MLLISKPLHSDFKAHRQAIDSQPPQIEKRHRCSTWGRASKSIEKLHVRPRAVSLSGHARAGATNQPASRAPANSLTGPIVSDRTDFGGHPTQPAWRRVRIRIAAHILQVPAVVATCRSESSIHGIEEGHRATALNDECRGSVPETSNVSFPALNPTKPKTASGPIARARAAAKQSFHRPPTRTGAQTPPTLLLNAQKSQMECGDDRNALEADTSSTRPRCHAQPGERPEQPRARSGARPVSTQSRHRDPSDSGLRVNERLSARLAARRGMCYFLAWTSPSAVENPTSNPRPPVEHSDPGERPGNK